MLENKLAFITGASRGIGMAIAIALGKKGAIIVGSATQEKGAQAITAHFQSENIKGKGVVLDVGSQESIHNALSQAANHFGPPLILVNNAGITSDNLLLRLKPEEWNRVIHTNLTGIYHLTQACTKPMLKSKWGRIINITSVVGVTGNPGQANYAAAKAGVIAFSKSIAYELATRNITVNCVAPGYIKTDMTQKLTTEQAKKVLAQIPMKKIGAPKDIAQAVCFLASDDASFITGETLHVNGGMYMS